jgi:hypothetical protein
MTATRAPAGTGTTTDADRVRHRRPRATSRATGHKGAN